MKKLTAFLAALLVSLSLVFTACGSSKPASNKKAPAKNSTKVTPQVGKTQPSFDLSSLLHQQALCGAEPQCAGFPG